MSSYRNVLLVVGVVLCLGFLRVLLESPRPAALETARAVAWSDCLAQSASAEIAAGTMVTLHSLASRDAAEPPTDLPPLTTIDFVATAPVPVALLDAAAREHVESGETVRLQPGQEVHVTAGEFGVAQGLIEVRRSGGDFLLEARDRLRFGPAGNQDYVVTLADEVAIGGNDAAGEARPAELPVGTTGKLELGDERAVALVPLQPLEVAPWLLGTAPSLLPERASGRKGLADLAIEVRRAGLRFDTPGVSLSACAALEDGSPEPAGVAEVNTLATGGSTILLSLPSGLLPVFSGTWTDVELAIATSDGRYGSFGSFVAVDRGWAALIAILLTGGLFWWLATIRHNELKSEKTDWSRWFAGLFIGADGEPSLSLFQVFIWTMITVWGLIYVFIVAGSLLSMTEEMMALLGIAGVGSVAARWIATTRPVSATSPSAAAPATPAASPTPAPAAPATAPERSPPLQFWQILSTAGKFDLLKLQLFVFTLLIGAYVLWWVLDTATFPALDTNTLLLLGVSQSVYIGGKLAATTGLARAQALKLELEVLKANLLRLGEQKQQLETEQTALEAREPSLSDAERTRLEQLADEITAKQAEIDKGKARIATIEDELRRAVQELSPAT